MNPLIQLPIKQRYELIRNFYNANGRNITFTSKQLGISYNTVKHAINNMNPSSRIYTKKLDEIHHLYIYSQTIENPFITGDEIAIKIFETFGIQVSGRTVNRCRNELNLDYRPPLHSVYLTPSAATQ